MLTRQREPEIMDDPSLAPREHERALRGLARLNTCSGNVWTLWHPIRRLANSLNTKELRVLDVATGSADNPIALWELAQRAGYNLQVDGCDISDVAIESSRKRAARDKAPCNFFRLNVLEDSLPHDYDVIMCSLFMHHLDRDQAIAVLRKMSAATKHLVLVNDLVRNYKNLLMVSVATQVVSRSHVVHFDGPASVRAAFTPTELYSIASDAGLQNAIVKERFPCRMLLEWKN